MLAGLLWPYLLIVAARVLSLTVEEVDGIELPDCLLEGSNVTFTCNIEGFPRPEVIFLKDSVPIVPGEREFSRVTSINRDQVSSLTQN